MAYVAESATWKNGVYQLETTDPLLGGANGVMNEAIKDLACRTLYLKGQQDNIKTEIQTARGGKASLNERFNALEMTSKQGDFNFNGTTGTTISHTIGNTNYVVNVAATTSTNGDLGDVYISRGAYYFTVYNTGGYTGGGRYQILN